MQTTTCYAHAPQLIDPVNRALLALSDQGAVKPGLMKLVSENNVACPQCGQNRLIKVLAHYRNGSVPDCEGCARTHAALEELSPKGDDRIQRRLMANMLQGVAQFGIGSGVVPAAPIIVTWELTARCNMGSCRHCHIAAASDDCCQEEISLDRALEVAEDLAEMGVCAVAFTGGECLMWPGFDELLRHATGLGLHCYLATNGLLLNRERVAQLKRDGLRLVHISLDGATAETHDSFRRCPGSFEQVMRAVGYCRDQGLQVAFASTPTQRNAHEMTAVLRLADRMKVDWVITYNYVPAGSGGADLDLEAHQKQRLWLDMMDESGRSAHTRWLSFAPQTAVLGRALGLGRELRPTHYYDPMLSGAQRMLASSPACMAGRFYLAIKADQRVIPCIFLPQEAGRLGQEKISRIWRASPVLESLRTGQDLKGACGRCAYGGLCGGCRARAKAVTGDYLAADPMCPINEGLAMGGPAEAGRGLQTGRRS